MKINNISPYIDHTNLRSDTTSKDIKKLCKEAIKYNFASVCINPCFVSLCKKSLKNSNVKVCTVTGFPLGASTTQTKIFETKKAIKDGADEIDMVINIGKLKEKKYKYIENEIREIVEIAKKNKVLTKVIIETCLLDNNEKVKACEIVVKAGADFVKTSTGFSTEGAKVEDIKLMKIATKSKIEIKASGGIRDYKTATQMIKAGATRIGASSGIKIVEEFLELSKK
ncbi:deoxyribose-phosphate aldolase [Pseudomonadota bacterium]